MLPFLGRGGGGDIQSSQLIEATLTSLREISRLRTMNVHLRLALCAAQSYRYAESPLENREVRIRRVDEEKRGEGQICKYPQFGVRDIAIEPAKPHGTHEQTSRERKGAEKGSPALASNSA